MSTLTVRIAQETEQPLLNKLLQHGYHLHAQAHPDTYHTKPPLILSRGTLISILEDPEQTLLVAEQDQKVIGLIHLMIESEDEDDYGKAYRRVSIEDIVVDPDHQHQGIGTALLEAAEAWSKDQKADYVTAIVYAFNTPAQHFFEKTNFKPRSIRVNKTVK